MAEEPDFILLHMHAGLFAMAVCACNFIIPSPRMSLKNVPGQTLLAAVALILHTTAQREHLQQIDVNEYAAAESLTHGTHMGTM